MKRTAYTAVLRHPDGAETTRTAYAMNSAIRASEALIREHAREVGAPFYGEVPTRDGDVYRRVWFSDNGTQLEAFAHPA